MVCRGDLRAFAMRKWHFVPVCRRQTANSGRPIYLAYKRILEIFRKAIDKIREGRL